MSKIKKAKEERAKVFGQIDELRKETDGKEMTAEERQKWDALTTDYDKRNQEVQDAEKFEEIEKRQIQEQEEKLPTTEQDKGKEERAAFIKFLQTGERTPQSEQRAGLDGVGRGVIVPDQLHKEMEIALKSYGGMLEASTIMYTETGGKLFMPTINTTATKAQIVAEYEQSKKGKEEFSSIELGAHTYRTPIIPISLELLQDSAFNLEQLLGGLLGDSFGRGLNEHLTTGTGATQPKGIVTAATAIAAKAAASAITYDDLMELMKALDSAYGKNAKFMFNKNTLYELMKIKDTENRYIYQNLITGGIAPSILGKEYILNEDMADIGASKTSVLYGDLKKYRTRIVRNFSVVRLNELLAEYLSIGIMGFGRADGNLLDAGTNPVMKLTHKAT